MITTVQIKHCPDAYLHKLAREREQNSTIAKIGLTKNQAAQALGVSEKTIERLVARGLLKPSRALRTPRFSVKSLAEFLEATSG